MKTCAVGQRTRWMEPDQVIDCQYGRVTVLTWLTEEAARITRATGRVAEVRESELQGAVKMVALFAS